MSLLRLPCVARKACGLKLRRMAAIICVTVVLPLLPVTAISGSLNWERQPVASAASASLASATSRPGRPAAASRDSASPWHMAATAPLALAWASKSLASKRSPRSATNRSPGSSVRVSVCTRLKETAPALTPLWVSASTRRAPTSQGLICCNVIISFIAMPLLCGGRNPISQRATHMIQIGKGQALACQLLIVLMTLAGDQQHVMGRSLA